MLTQKKYVIKKNKLIDRGLFVACLIIFKVLLDISYVCAISNIWSYSGFVLDFNSLKVIESYVLLIMMGLILPCNTKKPSQFFVVLLFSIVVTPLLSIFSLKNESRQYLYMIVSSFLIVLLVARMPDVKTKYISKGRIWAICFSVMLLIVVFTWIVAQGGLKYLNFNLVQVYEFRSMISSEIFYGVWGYLKFWIPKVVLPFLMVYFLWKRHVFVVFVVCFAQFMYFGITAHKAYLFYPFLVLFAYFFVERRWSLQIMLLGFAGVILASLALYVFFNEILPISLFVRRLFFATAENHYAYFYFFKDFGFIKMSDVKMISNFVQYPFDMPIVNVISQYRHGHPNAGVNTGFLATGYMHFGFCGMIVFSAITGLLLKLIDSIVVNQLSNWIGVAIMFIPIWSLSSSDLPTVILTHGFGLALLFLWLIASKPVRIKWRI